MSIFRDKQIKWFCFFIVIYAALIFGTAIWFSQNQIAAAKSMYLEHDSAIVSSLLEQGVSEEVIANAISSTEANNAGIKLLSDFGIGKNTMGTLLPHFSQFQYHSLSMSLFVCIFLIVILFIGVISFLLVRNQLYRQAGNIINNYINNDYSCHLPQHSEGAIFQLFASIEQLATMLQSKNETEHKAKEFLKTTIP